MNRVEILIRPYQSKDREQVVALWRTCHLVVPWNDPEDDIMTKQAFQPDLFFVGLLDGKIRATVMAGFEGHRGWINYLAVSPDLRREGIGRRMMEEAKARLRDLGCPKINLQIRSSNTGVIEFYKRIGFSVDDVVSMGKKLKPDV